MHKSIKMLKSKKKFVNPEIGSVPNEACVNYLIAKLLGPLKVLSVITKKDPGFEDIFNIDPFKELKCQLFIGGHDLLTEPCLALPFEPINKVSDGTGKNEKARAEDHADSVRTTKVVQLSDNFYERYQQIRSCLNGRKDVPAANLPEVPLSDYLKDFGTNPNSPNFFFEPFNSNLRLTAQIFGLSETERIILGFMILVFSRRTLFSLMFYYFDFSVRGAELFFDLISQLLDLNKKEVKEALRADAPLFKFNILIKHPHRRDKAFYKFADFNYQRGLPDLLHSPLTTQDFINKRLQPAPSAELEWKQFKYLPQIFNTLIPFLKNVIKEGKHGINILLYGPPGTGKTQLSRLISRELGATAYEMLPMVENKNTSKNKKKNKSSDEDENDKNWMASLKLLEGLPGSVLLVDEAEHFLNPRKKSRKAFITSALESNPVITIWTANRIRRMDPAFLRRFSCILKLDNPPFAYMKEFITEKLGSCLNPHEIDGLAVNKNVTPALIENAAESVKNLEAAGAPITSEFIYELLDNTLKAQNLPPLQRNPDPNTAFFDPKFTNSENDPEDLLERSKDVGRGRLCFYGPPGTGKTAFAHWVARCLGRPLIVKRASDLLDCFVGGTEHAIAEAFEEAKRSNAVLLIDEADSFLRSRNNSQKSWEITAVNEFLTQMEAFDGYFIATTNMLELIDTAAFRRFDLKNKFDYLLPQQCCALLVKYAEKMNFDVTDELLKEAERFTRLTPGDFAAVSRRLSFTCKLSAESLIDALRKEEEIKENPTGKSSVGFF